MTIQSNDSYAELHIMSGGTSDAGIKLTVPNNRNASLTLKETGGTAFHLVNRGARDRLVIADNEHDLVVITPESGDTRFRGDMTVGGPEEGQFWVD